MNVKTNVKAGGIRLNHNETFVPAAETKGPKAKTPAKGKVLCMVVDLDDEPAKGLKVKTNVKAGPMYLKMAGID